MIGMTKLIASFPYFLIILENAVHRSPGAEVMFLIKQGGVHFARRLINKARAVESLSNNRPRFVDQAPREVYATLLDEEHYLCSWRTMNRVLENNQEVRERRDQLRHPNHARPELVATAPNQLWNWDITKLLGPTKGTYYHLYVIIDVFSRY